MFSLKLWGRLVQRNVVKVSGNLIRQGNKDDPRRRSCFSLALAEFQCCPSAAQPCQLTPWVSEGKGCRQVLPQAGRCIAMGLWPPFSPWWLLIFGEAGFYRGWDHILENLAYSLKNMGSLFCAQLRW